jgi:predicted glycosyltransferase
MFYSHDSFGLGHLRRTLTLANHFHTNVPNLTQLIVTGSPAAARFRYPQGTSFVELPPVTKDDLGRYVPYSVTNISMENVHTMRQGILLNAAQDFKPDFLIVDHSPAGLCGEAVATLRHLRQVTPETKLILGLRDVVDEAAKVRQTWAREGIYDLFDTVYDRILVYGIRDYYDVVAHYGLSHLAESKTRFVGYLGRQPGLRSPEDVRANLNMRTDKLVVVTAGGGGDGRALYDAMLHALQVADERDFDCLVIGGPLLSDAHRADVQAIIGHRNNVHFQSFTDDVPSYLGAADAVISMGGYNTVCEILSLERPAIIVPRIHPRKEQLIRARILSDRGIVRMIHPHELTTERLLTSAHELLARPAAERPVLPMDGLANVTDELVSLCQQRDSVWNTIRA